MRRACVVKYSPREPAQLPVPPDGKSCSAGCYVAATGDLGLRFLTVPMNKDTTLYSVPFAFRKRLRFWLLEEPMDGVEEATVTLAAQTAELVLTGNGTQRVLSV